MTNRVLFIEDTVPLRRIGSGFVRANDLIRVMAAGMAPEESLPEWMTEALR